MQDKTKRLYRSSSNKMIAGVCGGIAEYLKVDPTAVRVAWILLSVLPFVPGIILYVIAWLVIPKNPAGVLTNPTSASSSPASAFLGFFFVALGALIFLGNLDVLDWEEWWDFSWEYVLPLLLIAVGVFFVARPSKITEEQTTAETHEPVMGSTAGKTLRRSRADRKIGGICGGLGAYLNIDPSFVRIAFVFFAIWPFGLGAVVYLIMLLVIPEEELQPAKQP
ncbi:MAG: PspC domain-containing protein [Bacteroidota bacterium]